jgi:hypothetical protein
VYALGWVNGWLALVLRVVSSSKFMLVSAYPTLHTRAVDYNYLHCYTTTALNTVKIGKCRLESGELLLKTILYNAAAQRRTGLGPIDILGRHGHVRISRPHCFHYIIIIIIIIVLVRVPSTTNRATHNHFGKVAW